MRLSGEFLHADGHIESFKFPEAEAISRLIAFPWDAQLHEAELLKKCSPTVSLEYPEKACLLWASVVEKHKESEFLVHFEKDAGKACSENDGIALSLLPELIRSFYRGDFDALTKAISKPSQERSPTRAQLVKRLLFLELFPLIGAIAYGYCYPRYVLVALCVYALLALSSISISIRDGVVLEKYGLVCLRAKDRFGFWFEIAVRAFFPLLILSVALMSPSTLVWPPK
jgi:hypothetical protein